MNVTCLLIIEQEGPSLIYGWWTRDFNPQSGLVMRDYGYIDEEEEEEDRVWIF